MADNAKIEDLIYEVRGVQVMLDSYLARLYQVETKRINEAAMRYIDRFPERFTFQLSEKNINICGFNLKP